jgi:trehalose 6-phosphate phosphatase
MNNKSRSKPYWQDVIESLLTPFRDRARVGVVTDVDGTISPIVNDPDAAQITPRSRELLAALVPQLTLVAVISGRAAADVQARVGVPGVVYVGNHGLERWVDDHVALPPEVAAHRPAVAAAAADLAPYAIDGIQLEDKGASLSLHYRRAADPDAAAQTLGPAAAEIAAAHGLRLFSGRMIYELRPPIDVHKGTALRSLTAEYDLEAVMYLGDDTTDSDALRAAGALRASGACYGLGVGVAADETPDAVIESADVLAAGIADVEALFSWLLKARSASLT